MCCTFIETRQLNGECNKHIPDIHGIRLTSAFVASSFRAFTRRRCLSDLEDHRFRKIIYQAYNWYRYRFGIDFAFDMNCLIVNRNIDPLWRTQSLNLSSRWSTVQSQFHSRRLWPSESRNFSSQCMESTRLFTCVKEYSYTKVFVFGKSRERFRSTRV